jgi:hypothetical protein
MYMKQTKTPYDILYIYTCVCLCVCVCVCVFVYLPAAHTAYRFSPSGSGVFPASRVQSPVDPWPSVPTGQDKQDLSPSSFCVRVLRAGLACLLATGARYIARNAHTIVQLITSQTERVGVCWTRHARVVARNALVRRPRTEAVGVGVGVGVGVDLMRDPPPGAPPPPQTPPPPCGMPAAVCLKEAL